MRTLILSHVASHPVTTAQSTRLKYLVEAMEEMGHEVEYAYIPSVIPCDMAGMAAYWGGRLHVLPSFSADIIAQRPVRSLIVDRIRHELEYRIARIHNLLMACWSGRWDAWYNRAVHRYLSVLQRERKYDIVVVLYGVFSKAFQAFSRDTLRVLDTNDVYLGRKELMEGVGLRSKWSTTEQEETQHLNRADIVLAITNEDARRLSSLTRRPIRVVGHLAPVTTAKPSPSGGTEMLFVGSNNSMNKQAAQFLINDILPRLRVRMLGARILFAGDICGALSPGDGYTLLGKVENLQSVYERSALVVNPMFAGTGLATKTIEGLAHGKPVVATRIGARGMLKGVGHAITVADGPDEFAAAVARILESPQLAADLALAAHRFAAEYRQSAFENFQACFDGKRN